MKKILLSAALGCLAGAAQADVTVMSWGGAYGFAQNEAHLKPFAEKTGIRTVMVDTDNAAGPIKAMVQAGDVTVDVTSLELSDAIRLCDEGMLEPIDPAILPAGSDGTPAAEDFFHGGITDCAVATDLWANVIAFDSSKFAGEKPSAAADFFDTDRFPGKRGLKKSAKAVLELALLGDGVPADQVYALLATREGQDRAFARLDKIKRDIVWWEAGAQPPQLLADGEVAMTTAYNGRIFNALIDEGKPFEIIWDGQIYELNVYAIPKGAKNLEQALDFVRFATSTEGLARQAGYISYGPARRSSNALDIIYKDGHTVMRPNLPSSPENMGNALESSSDFWVDRDAELNERFNAWLMLS
ncbi:putative spermidine/putrescine transport system substrate-binding protein [Paracoccus aminovorans]|uniref:Putative spermidine/putrescine transport system substrate-binding protein n=1 Tax=Paracoccus aminovorans TaxID=34004 RepID=A0A1I2ZS72_9RHOB|nr:ABC transporter substrate-binding protein [Paracoccus aminovorans]CQR84114.1 polyamine ABC transporter, periplasmic polyamine-binding protein [Paracoccus aminovorans]SFH40456.1 putative spermidine/putrescine transport system substrate-binding protein [Paracoccus aminovorans]